MDVLVAELCKAGVIMNVEEMSFLFYNFFWRQLKVSKPA
jgi:hypothetical protein